MKRLALVIFLLLSCPAFAYDGFDIKGLQPLPPFGVFSTFSTESLKRNQFGIGIGIEKSSEPSFNRSYLQLAYGLHDKFELNLTIPYVSNFYDTSGFEDFSFGIKHRLRGESRYLPSFAYILMVSANSGKNEFSTEGGLGWGLILTKKIGPFKGHLNFLHTKPGSSRFKDQYILTIGSELAVTHNSKILAEIAGRKNFVKNKLDLLEWRLGYRVATTDNIFTTIGAGFDIKNRTPDYRLMLLISIILPKEEKTIQRVYE